MNINDFGFAFWHPFGPYCNLSGKQILDWKTRETIVHSWTFWSFAYMKSLAVWADILAAQSPTKPVYVFCSHSPNSQDPASGQTFDTATHYQLVNQHEWLDMPDQSQMFVTNPFKHRGMASAFKVQRVYVPDAPIQLSLPIEWYSTQNKAWRSDLLPTRGQYLVRQGGAARLRSIAAVLELSYPFFATLKSASASI